MNAALKQLATVVAEAVVDDWIAEHDAKQSKKKPDTRKANPSQRKAKK